MTSLFLLLLSQSTLSQITEEEHLSHHPEEVSTDEAPTSTNEMIPSELRSESDTLSEAKMAEDSGMMGGKGGAKGGMMAGCPNGNCGKKSPTTWDMYPRMMNLKELTREKKVAILKAADKRIREGRTLILSGFNVIKIDNKLADFSKLEKSLEEIRQGISQFSSGVAAKKAITEGKAPQNIALRWFKKEMNLIPMSLQPNQKHSFLFGMSFFHTSIMSILILFMVTMIWMYFFKMKRAATLLENLSKRPTAEDSEPIVLEEIEPTKKENVSAIKSVDKVKFSSNKFSGSLKVIGIFDEAPAVKTFRLAHINNSSLEFTYEPGQFVTFMLEIDGKKVSRSYTIASSPTEKDYIEVTIKREDKGLVSRYFHDQLEVNGVVKVNAPNGKFYFNGTAASSIVLISGGVGITPMMSAVRYLTDKCWPGEIYFLFCSRTSNDFIYQKELEYLQSRHANLNVLASMTRVKVPLGWVLKEDFQRIS